MKRVNRRERLCDLWYKMLYYRCQANSGLPGTSESLQEAGNLDLVFPDATVPSF